MNVRPLFDRILVKRSDEPTKSTGGLFLPETAKDKPSEGVILAVGTGKLNKDGTVHDLAVAVGDRVVFGKYAGTEIKVDGDDRLILREEDILGVLD
ncbi:MAG: co-chaperone GroES [Proteobacteria bacterium]|nr:co-chaperone GroES [Pseudomonadota bacterium]MCP4920309.1 co-chaperone GroES [Pseudomonadota bacterium]